MLEKAKGFYGRRKNTIRTAKAAVDRAGQYAYRDRKVNKRNFRSLWIQRINAAAREEGFTYSQFIHGLALAGIEMDRKVLSDIAGADPVAFKAIAEQVRTALGASPAGRRLISLSPSGRGIRAQRSWGRVRGRAAASSSSRQAARVVRPLTLPRRFAARAPPSPARGEGPASGAARVSDLASLQADLEAAVDAAPDVQGLEAVRVSALGKSGSISALLKSLGAMSPDARRELGPRINGLRDAVQARIAARREALETAALDAQLAAERSTSPCRRRRAARARCTPRCARWTR